jgi:hypothetical protein
VNPVGAVAPVVPAIVVFRTVNTCTSSASARPGTMAFVALALSSVESCVAVE